MSSFDSTFHIFCTCTSCPVLCDYYFLYCKKSEISCFLVKKLQFEAHTQHITDCAEGVEADQPHIERGEDLDGSDKAEVEDQAESGSLYESQMETETETETR